MRTWPWTSIPTICCSALAPRLEGLTLRIALAADAPAVYLRSQLRGDPLGDVLRLVIPPPAPLDGVQRQGHDHFHPVVQPALLQTASVPLAHRAGRAPRSAVFESADQLPPPASVNVVEKTRSPLDGQHVPALRQQGIVRLKPEPRQGRRRAAQRAHRAFALRERDAADGAARRKEKRRDVAQQVTEDRHCR